MDISRAMASASAQLEAERRAKARRMRKYPEPVVIKTTYGNLALTCLGALEICTTMGWTYFTHLSANPKRPCGPFLPKLLAAQKALQKARRAYDKALREAHDYGNEVTIADVPAELEAEGGK